MHQSARRGGAERDRAILLGLLKGVDPATIDADLVAAVASHFVIPCYEAVCLRKRAGKDEVLLTMRPHDAPAYAGQWHCPGTMVRKGEDDDAVFARLGRDEFGGQISRWTLIGNFSNLREDRGHFLSIIYLVRVEQPSAGEWFEVYPTMRLPAPMAAHHITEVIPRAVAAWLRKVWWER